MLVGVGPIIIPSTLFMRNNLYSMTYLSYFVIYYKATWPLSPLMVCWMLNCLEIHIIYYTLVMGSRKDIIKTCVSLAAIYIKDRIIDWWQGLPLPKYITFVSRSCGNITGKRENVYWMILFNVSFFPDVVVIENYASESTHNYDHVISQGAWELRVYPTFFT